MNPWLELIRLFGAPLLAGIVAAFLTNYFSARFSLARFREEQWWIEKRDAYDAIIRKLADIKFGSAREMASMETMGEMVPPKAPDRQKALACSLQEVASTGGYIVSADTVEAVQKVLRALGDREQDIYRELEKAHDAADEALKVIRAEAHRDLRVEKKGGGA